MKIDTNSSLQIIPQDQHAGRVNNNKTIQAFKGIGGRTKTQNSANVVNVIIGWFKGSENLHLNSQSTHNEEIDDHNFCNKSVHH